MKGLVISILLMVTICIAVTQAAKYQGAEVEDNEFAEFEDFDDDEEFENVPVQKKEAPTPKEPTKKVVMSPEAAANEAETNDDEEGVVEDEEDDEYEHLQDDEEFEGFDPDVQGPKGKQGPPDLQITKIPLHLRTNWDSFYLEMLMLAGLGVYFLNFLAGKSKNSKLAQAWFNSHKELLESNFAIVGDDGTTPEVTKGVFIKESENVYNLWCSGRVCCEGMLVTLKFLKRQDLVSTIARLIKPSSDQIVIKVTLEDLDMDNFVFCLANKKLIGKLQKDMQDLSWYGGEKKGVDKYRIPSSFQMISEIGEATAAILDAKVVACLTKYESQVESIHISDQYSGLKNQDETPTKMPETEKVLLFSFNVPGQGKCTPKDMDNMKPLMQLVFHLVDKVKRLKLGREGKLKAERNRSKVSEGFMKITHQQRAEAAQQRKEDKRRAEKDRIMAEEDPDKQRKLEAKSLKKEGKKGNTKMKMMKVKAM